MSLIMKYLSNKYDIIIYLEVGKHIFYIEHK